MSLPLAKSGKILLIALLVCAFLPAQAQAGVFGHLHQDYSQHFCWLCQGIATPFLPALSIFTPPVLRIAPLEWSGNLNQPPDVAAAPSFSRGPPA